MRSFRAPDVKDATTALETPFVVKMHKISKLSTIEEAFTFVHPNRCEATHNTPIDNERHIAIKFSRPEASGDAMVHGFAGYFDCKLFKVRSFPLSCVAFAICHTITTYDIYSTIRRT